MFEKICIGLLTLSALALVGVRLSPDPAQATTEIGDPAPLVVVERPDGRAVEVDGAGPTLLVFFSTTCEWCMRSLPTYKEMSQADCDLRVVLAVVDVSGGELESWIRSQGPLGAPPCGEVEVGSVSRPLTYDVPGTPTHYLLRDGKIVQKQPGALLEVPAW